MTSLSRRLAGVVAAATALVVAVWPAQPAQASTPVVVDVAIVSFYGGSNINMHMRASLPTALRARGTCTLTLVKVTTTDLGGGVVGTSYSLVDSHSGSCEYSTSPQWGDRRSAWTLQYPYGSHQYIVKAEFSYGDLYGYDYRTVTAPG